MTNGSFSLTVGLLDDRINKCQHGAGAEDGEKADNQFPPPSTRERPRSPAVLASLPRPDAGAPADGPFRGREASSRTGIRSAPPGANPRRTSQAGLTSGPPYSRIGIACVIPPTDQDLASCGLNRSRRFRRDPCGWQGCQSRTPPRACQWNMRSCSPAMNEMPSTARRWRPTTTASFPPEEKDTSTYVRISILNKRTQ